ncbi:hypothetical protein H6G54_02085 [Anabaena cylindrica FACHB-243]|uniref:Sulfotransferase n=1 Tax=Anabaena cylindrica (strain ATCC 27899 / PCC 7122) TaxID=272123 RepID=K9ZK69_ANACC|nr:MULTISPECIES: hypothetical protein [Anabaena]AFZ59169.1 hypothetical protein Anacy_3788 [Anabaena cylindrica PCC 7122]MBD2416519.1 hypothetical protein [Anabaena cylindrica FACHB-243]MBY5281091.1 hypothetical protein [Anabaena sp. CCAP 1446/1C]MBY5309878.1 hypothetical protein [Anabaena sp. CCAP 1446/1C]MCM2407457.1 hypothetical protein [Anabaena sp. CCAP 1446/1C]
MYKIYASPIPITINFDATVNSFGGVGTSFFMRFFEKFIRLNCSHNTDLIKHTDTPPLTHKIKFKAIYIYGNPMEAVVSIFMRKYHGLHSQYMLRNYAKIQPILKEETLESYLTLGEDKFKIEAHFHNWFYASRHYPILFLKYEYIWDFLPEIFDFLDIEHEYIKDFPPQRNRNSNLSQLPDNIIDSLNNMYGGFAKELETRPPFLILPPKIEQYPLSLFQLPLAVVQHHHLIHPGLTFSTFFPKAYSSLKSLQKHK